MKVHILLRNDIHKWKGIFIVGLNAGIGILRLLICKPSLYLAILYLYSYTRCILYGDNKHCFYSTSINIYCSQNLSTESKTPV
jgi:hypothetical protein